MKTMPCVSMPDEKKAKPGNLSKFSGGPLPAAAVFVMVNAGPSE